LDVNKNTPNFLGVNIIERLGVKLNKTQLKMLDMIISNDKITIVEMAKNISISETAIENNIKKLKEKGVVARLGSDKTGNWKIN
jgi:ATP-dependent DNA helicase RecG